MLRNPPDIISPRFGRDSFKRHSEAALIKEARIKVYRSKGLSLDIDEPKDLMAPLDVESQARFHILLKDLRLDDRLREG